MARKAVNGYPEKSYYDNTRFNGIVATSDPLNEGSFALLTNVDIADTGLSIGPRNGYTTTTFKLDEQEVTLSNKTLLFRDPKIQRDIVIDLAKRTEETPSFAYIVDINQYNLDNNLLVADSIISTYDATDVLNYFNEPTFVRIPGFNTLTEDKLSYLFRYTNLLSGHKLEPIRDTDGVIYYIGKFEYRKDFTWPFTYTSRYTYWLKFLYRKDATTVGGVTYTADTLVISVIDLDTQTANFIDRNIASKVSIIPNPLRTQEIVDVETSTLSDVNRPILFQIGSRYLTAKAPYSHKTALDIKVKPTFHLQDPKRIVDGTNASWAYRFDIINTAYTDENVIYKTPWRKLLVANTMATPTSGGTENPIISQLEMDMENNNDTVYTYYVMSERAHSWYQVLDATAYLTSIDVAEAKLYEKMKNNTSSGTNGAVLGNLAFAYLKHKTLSDTIPSTTTTLADIESTVYDQMGFRFITGEAMSAAVTQMGYNVTTLTDRAMSLSSAEVSACSGVYTADTSSMNCPIFPMTYQTYSGISKMTFSEFLVHAKAQEKSHKIKIVFVPYIYRHAGSVTGTPFDNVYICSLGGIYITGLRTFPTSPTGDTEPYTDVSAVKKSASLTPAVLERYVDIFKDFGSMSLQNILDVVPRSCFARSISIILYLKPYNDEMLAQYTNATTAEKALYNASWSASAFTQSGFAVWVNDSDVVYIDEVDEENPKQIHECAGSVVYEDRLIVWQGNNVYISNEGAYHYFTNTLKKIFPEEVLKVIAFKTILLVFTTQNLYAIYRAEIDTLTGAYTSAGEPEYAKSIVWLQQAVLYNINPSRKYLDIIQVYNQMILFYSSEGQLYMIKPSTMIDSETQFGIQYFNKSANNILGNYEQYINDRLIRYYKIDPEDTEAFITKDDIDIKALIDIDNIKIIYSVPGKIAFILIYDVVNNRYTTYDSLSFNDVLLTKHVEGGELYLTRHGDNTFFTLPVIATNSVDKNVDMHYAKMFKKEPIFSYIDTGNLNLNNHIKKRLRDLRIVLKNLDSTKILYNAELVVDDYIVRPLYGDDFKVRMLNGPDEMLVVDKVPVEDMNELFGMDQTIGVEGSRTDINSYYLYDDDEFFTRNSLLKTETLNSSRLIEYNSSILSIGKVVRIRLQFISKGKYKLQSFGMTYKERRL